MFKTLLASYLALGLMLGAQAQTKPADKPAAPAAAAAPAKPAAQIDINSATEKELTTLKGVGDARAKAIIQGRPYKGKDELVSKNIVPEAVYKDIKEQIIAKQK